MNHDQTFRAVLIAVLLLILPIGIYHRLKSQATCERLDRWQGSVHFGDVTACGHCSLAGADRLGDRSRLDGLVLGVPSNLVEVDRSRHDCNCLRVTAVDLTLPREELDGYGGYTSTAHLGHTWPLSLGPASVLRLCRVARRGGFADCGELVPICDRRRAVLSVHHPNANRRRESGCPLWGQL